MVQPPHLPGTGNTRPPDLESRIRGAGLAEPGRYSRAGAPPDRPGPPFGSLRHRVFVFWGVFAFALWPTLSGMALVCSGKLWFLDRMAWLWENMRDVNEEYP